MRGGSCKRDILVADAEELQENVAAEVYVKRINVKEVIVVKEGDKCIFPWAKGMLKLAGTNSEVRTSEQSRQGPEKEEENSGDHPGDEHDESDLAKRQQRVAMEEKWFLEYFLKLSAVGIMFKNDNIDMCLKKARFLFHWNTSTFFGERTLLWTCCRNAILMIVGTLMVTGTYPGHGLVLPTSQDRIMLHLKDILGPGGDLTK